MCKPPYLPSLGALLPTHSPFAGYGGRRPPRAPRPPVVTVAVPVGQAVTDHVDFSGKTVAVDSIQLRAPAGGYLQNVEYEEGDEVKNDQILAHCW